jgi:hypothetical protein
VKRSSSTLVLWLTHFDDPEGQAAFARLAREASPWAQVLQVHHSEAIKSQALQSDIVTIANADLSSSSERRRQQMLQPDGRLAPGRLDCLHMALISRFSGYEHVWFMEYDVDFSGPWANFFSELSASKADLLGTTLWPRIDCQSWPHWKSFRAPAYVPETTHIRGFFPVVRMSQRFAATYAEELATEAWGGHFEALYPTIAVLRGLLIEDIGGEGSLAPATRRNRFYENSRSDPFLESGTFRFRPAVASSYYPSVPPKVPENQLYHPIKTPANSAMETERLRKDTERLRGHIVSLEGEIANQKQVMKVRENALRGKISSFEEVIKEQKGKISSLEEVIKKQKHDLSRLRKIEASFTWRTTAVVRNYIKSKPQLRVAIRRLLRMS